MTGVNKVIIVGQVGKTPEVRHLDNGTAVANFSLAANETYKDKNGNKVDQTEWFNVVLWRGLAEVAEKYVKKGDTLYIEGKLRTKSYEKDGITRYTTSVVGDQMTMLGGNKQSDDMEGAQNRDMGQQQSTPSDTPTSTPTDDDTLPF